MATINQVAIKILVDGKEMEATLGEFNNLTKKAGVSGQKAGGSIKGGFTNAKIGIMAAAAAVTGIIMGLNKAVNAASAFEEANSKFEVVFKGNEELANSMRDTLVDAYAMSRTEASRFLSSIQDLLVPMGMNKDAAADMSGEVVRLAADLGSFNDLPTETVMLDIQSALVGNFETMKKYGVILNEHVVKQKAMNDGVWNGKGRLDAATKSQIAYKLIVEGSAAAVGDMERTSEGYANTKKRVTARVEDLMVKLGEGLMPIFKKVLELFEGFVAFSEKIIEAWGNIAEAIGASTDNLKLYREEAEKLEEAELKREIRAIAKEIKILEEKQLEMAKGGITAWDRVRDAISLVTHNTQNLGGEFARTGERIDELKRKQNEFKDVLIETTDEENVVVKNAIDKMGEDWKVFYKTLSDKDKQKVDEWIANQDLQMEFENELWITKEEAAIARDEAEKQREITKLDFIATANAKAYFKKLKDDKKAAEDKKKLDETASRAEIILHQETLSSISSIFGSLFGKSKAAAYAQAIINTWLGVTKVIGQTGIASPFAIPAILASGFAAAAQISATKYALGGEINKPTLALAGEAGPEIAAPRKTFVDVVNQMTRSGEIGGGDSKLLKEIKGMREAFEDQELVVTLEDDQLAIRVERGDAILGERDY